MALLGMVSMKLGRSLEWDGATERIIGDEAANKHLSPRLPPGLRIPEGLKAGRRPSNPPKTSAALVFADRVSSPFSPRVHSLHPRFRHRPRCGPQARHGHRL